MIFSNARYPHFQPAAFPPENCLPRIPSFFNDTYERNAQLVEKVAKSSFADALHVWMGGVSGGLRDGDHEVASKFSRAGQPDWDYIVKKGFVRGGVDPYPRASEDAGNANYAVTGYALFSKLFREMGFSFDTSDGLTRLTLAVGSAQYQWISDIGYGFEHWWQSERTFYGEDKRDAEVMALMMDYARYREIRNISEELGIEISPETFGLPKEVLDCFRSVHESERARIKREDDEARARDERRELRLKIKEDELLREKRGREAWFDDAMS